jgi:hypothetical protein
MIRVFVGSNEPYREQERVLEYSIREHTDADVEITFMRPGENGLTACGCTGFSQFRFCVPELAGKRGYAIYLDVDMILLANIAELWVWRRAGKWVCLKNGKTEVSVIDCTLRLPPKAQICGMQKAQARAMVSQRMVPCIPPEWNVTDKVTPGMKLLHFTNLRTQPWLGKEHPNPEAMAVLREYEARVA